VQVHIQLYLLAHQAEHQAQVEALLRELNELSEREHLHGISIETILMQGFLKRAVFDLPEAIERLELAERLAKERGIERLA